MLAVLLYFLLAAGFSDAVFECTTLSHDSACSIDGVEILEESLCDYPVDRMDLNNVTGVTIGNFGNAVWEYKYAIFLLDPDFLYFNTRGRYFLLWAVTNVPGSAIKNATINPTNTKEGTTLIDYSPPSFARNTRSHRVVALVFEQKPNATLSVSSFGIQRLFFNLATWLVLRRNQVLCIPVAAFQIRVS